MHGSHQVGIKARLVITKKMYYWLSILKYYIDYINLLRNVKNMDQYNK